MASATANATSMPGSHTITTFCGMKRSFCGMSLTAAPSKIVTPTKPDMHGGNLGDLSARARAIGLGRCDVQIVQDVQRSTGTDGLMCESNALRQRRDAFRGQQCGGGVC